MAYPTNKQVAEAMYVIYEAVAPHRRLNKAEEFLDSVKQELVDVGILDSDCGPMPEAK